MANEGERYYILAYLVAMWIVKNYPQKQYSLVIKKTLNYSKKSKEYEKIVQEYEMYGKWFERFIVIPIITILLPAF